MQEATQLENPFEIESAAVSDRGLNEARPQNEDSYLDQPGFGIFAVADGVGGAQAGEVASQMAIEILNEAFANMGAEGAVGVLYRRELAENDEAYRKTKVADFEKKFANPYIAAERGFIDEVIEPRYTRPKLIRALSLLQNKRDQNPPRKHVL